MENLELGMDLETSSEALSRLGKLSLTKKAEALEDLGAAFSALANAGQIIARLHHTGVDVQALLDERGIELNASTAQQAVKRKEQLDIVWLLKNLDMVPPRDSATAPQARPPSAICLQSFKRIGEALGCLENVPEWFNNLSQPQKDALKQSIGPAITLIELLSDSTTRQTSLQP